MEIIKSNAEIGKKKVKLTSADLKKLQTHKQESAFVDEMLEVCFDESHIFRHLEDPKILDEAFLEAFKVLLIGQDSTALYLNIQGRRYGYAPLAGMTVKEMFKKFKDIAKHSQGKALAWLKKNSKLISGSIKGKDPKNRWDPKKESIDQLTELAQYPRFFRTLVVNNGGVILAYNSPGNVVVGFPTYQALTLVMKKLQRYLPNTKLQVKDKLDLVIPITSLTECNEDDQVEDVIGKTKEPVSKDLEKSRKAKIAARDPETREKKRKAQAEYERSPDARSKHKAVGRANSRRDKLNTMKKSEELIRKVRAGVDPLTIIQEAKIVAVSRFTKFINKNVDQELIDELEFLEKLLGAKMKDIVFITEDDKEYEALDSEISQNGKELKTGQAGTPSAHGASYVIYDYKGVKVVFTNDYGYGALQLAAKDLSRFVKSLGT